MMAKYNTLMIMSENNFPEGKAVLPYQNARLKKT